MEFGVHQGSPITPLLFTLYMNVSIQLADYSDRFRYAYDVAAISIGNNPKEAIVAAQSNANKFL